jgi:hypothetical protein
MTRSSPPCEALDLERDLVTTEEDVAALRRERPTRPAGDLEHLDPMVPPEWAAPPRRQREVFPPQPPFEL